MRILVVGAGATGGYFGGRLAEAGRDVTFLVRPKRAAQLAANGLVIRSGKGDANVPSPRTILAESIAEPFDLILLGCKAYDLDGAIAAFAPAVGPATAILPVLNGMRHLEVLDARFGRARVLAGQCIIAATLDERGAIIHMNENHSLTFGERDKGLSERVQAIAAVMAGARFEPRASDNAMQDMWEKWVVLATLAGSTCLMRAAVGDIVAAPAGSDVVARMLEDCVAIASANGHAPRADLIGRAVATLSAPGSTLTASMLRDVERGAAIEADHIIGDLLARGAVVDRALVPSLLQVAYAHLKAYEARRTRTSAEKSA